MSGDSDTAVPLFITPSLLGMLHLPANMVRRLLSILDFWCTNCASTQSQSGFKDLEGALVMRDDGAAAQMELVGRVEKRPDGWHLELDRGLQQPHHWVHVDCIKTLDFHQLRSDVQQRLCADYKARMDAGSVKPIGVDNLLQLGWLRVRYEPMAGLVEKAIQAVPLADMPGMQAYCAEVMHKTVLAVTHVMSELPSHEEETFLQATLQQQLLLLHQTTAHEVQPDEVQQQAGQTPAAAQQGPAGSTGAPSSDGCSAPLPASLQQACVSVATNDSPGTDQPCQPDALHGRSCRQADESMQLSNGAGCAGRQVAVTGGSPAKQVKCPDSADKLTQQDSAQTRITSRDRPTGTKPALSRRSPSRQTRSRHRRSSRSRSRSASPVSSRSGRSRSASPRSPRLGRSRAHRRGRRSGRRRSASPRSPRLGRSRGRWSSRSRSASPRSPRSMRFSRDVFTQSRSRSPARHMSGQNMWHGSRPLPGPPPMAQDLLQERRQCTLDYVQRLCRVLERSGPRGLNMCEIRDRCPIPDIVLGALGPCQWFRSWTHLFEMLPWPDNRVVLRAGVNGLQGLMERQLFITPSLLGMLHLPANMVRRLLSILDFWCTNCASTQSQSGFKDLEGALVMCDDGAAAQMELVGHVEKRPDGWYLELDRGLQQPHHWVHVDCIKTLDFHQLRSDVQQRLCADYQARMDAGSVRPIGVDNLLQLGWLRVRYEPMAGLVEKAIQVLSTPCMQAYCAEVMHKTVLAITHVISALPSHEEETCLQAFLQQQLLLLHQAAAHEVQPDVQQHEEHTLAAAQQDAARAAMPQPAASAHSSLTVHHRPEVVEPPVRRSADHSPAPQLDVPGWPLGQSDVTAVIHTPLELLSLHGTFYISAPLPADLQQALQLACLSIKPTSSSRSQQLCLSDICNGSMRGRAAAARTVLVGGVPCANVKEEEMLDDLDDYIAAYLPGVLAQQPVIKQEAALDGGIMGVQQDERQHHTERRREISHRHSRERRSSSRKRAEGYSQRDSRSRNRSRSPYRSQGYRSSRSRSPRRGRSNSPRKSLSQGVPEASTAGSPPRSAAGSPDSPAGAAFRLVVEDGRLIMAGTGDGSTSSDADSDDSDAEQCADVATFVTKARWAKPEPRCGIPAMCPYMPNVARFNPEEPEQHRVLTFPTREHARQGPRESPPPSPGTSDSSPPRRGRPAWAGRGRMDIRGMRQGWDRSRGRWGGPEWALY